MHSWGVTEFEFEFEFEVKIRLKKEGNQYTGAPSFIYVGFTIISESLAVSIYFLA